MWYIIAAKKEKEETPRELVECPNEIKELLPPSHKSWLSLTFQVKLTIFRTNN